MSVADERLSPDETEPRPRLGPYEFLDRVGGRHGGASFRGRHARTGFPVFLRLQANDPSYTRLHRQAFLRACARLTKLDHPNLARVLAGGWESGFRYLIMNYLHGLDLESVVNARGPLAEKLVIHLGRRIAAGLEGLHAAGLVHGTVRPDHVIIRDDGLAKLAGLISAARCGPAPRAQNLLLRSPEYVSFAAPELVSPGLPVDFRADLYGLGATLYFAATGRPLFRSDPDLKTLFHRVMKKAPASPRRRGAEIGPELAGLILSLVRKTPGRRPSTLDDVRAALARCSGAA